MTACGWLNMSWNYAREQIEQALASTKGNALASSRLVADAALHDARLMLELAGPHLKGIVSHAVSHVIREQATGGPHARGHNDDHADAPDAINMPLDQFGRELLGALSGRDTPRFGSEAYGAVQTGSRKAASKAHIDAMKRIARVEE